MNIMNAAEELKQQQLVESSHAKCDKLSYICPVTANRDTISSIVE